MSFRAHFNDTEGTFVIDQWDSKDERFKPDGKYYFATEVEAMRKVASRLEKWIAASQQRLADLKAQIARS